MKTLNILRGLAVAAIFASSLGAAHAAPAAPADASTGTGTLFVHWFGHLFSHKT